MKRSEVVDKMAEIMEDHFDGDNGSWWEDADAVLKYLEGIGMLPPCIYKTRFGKYSPAHTCDFNWEKEDEKK